MYGPSYAWPFEAAIAPSLCLTATNGSEGEEEEPLYTILQAPENSELCPPLGTPLVAPLKSCSWGCLSGSGDLCLLLKLLTELSVKLVREARA